MTKTQHKFTLDYLRTVPIPDDRAQLNISDPKDTYLVCRIGRKKRSWYCVKKIRGTRKGAISFYISNINLMGLEEARKESRKIAAICDEGKDPRGRKSEQLAITLGEAFETYKKYRMRGHKDLTVKARVGLVKNYLTNFKDRKLFSIEPQELAELVQTATYQLPALNATMLLSRVWEMASGSLKAEDARSIPKNPFYIMKNEILGLQVYREIRKTGETAVLKRKDLGRYIAFLEDGAANGSSHSTRVQFGAFLLCLYTGLRIGEATTLAWDSVDWESNTIKIQRTFSKSKVEHIVYMSNYVLSFLTQLAMDNSMSGDPSPFVFPRARNRKLPFSSMTRKFDRITNFLGYRFTSHANRRTFFCFALKVCKIDFVSAQKMLNHKTKGASVAEKHYAMLEEFEPNGLAKEFELLSKMLCEERAAYPETTAPHFHYFI